MFTEHRPFPLKTNHYEGLKLKCKSLLNICRPKTITKASATTTAHICSNTTSITLVMSVEKKSQDLRLSSELHASYRRTFGRGSSRLQKRSQRPLVSLKKRRLQRVQELLTVNSMSFFSFVHLILLLYIYAASYSKFFVFIYICSHTRILSLFFFVLVFCLLSL